jgi:hypothetical protein
MLRGTARMPDNGDPEKRVHVPLSLPGTACDDPTKRRSDSRNKRVVAAMSLDTGAISYSKPDPPNLPI